MAFGKGATLAAQWWEYLRAIVAAIAGVGQRVEDVAGAREQPARRGRVALAVPYLGEREVSNGFRQTKP